MLKKWGYAWFFKTIAVDFLQLLSRIADSLIIIYSVDYLLIKGVRVKVVKLINKVVDCGKMW